LIGRRSGSRLSLRGWAVVRHPESSPRVDSIISQAVGLHQPGHTDAIKGRQIRKRVAGPDGIADPTRRLSTRVAWGWKPGGSSSRWLGRWLGRWLARGARRSRWGYRYACRPLLKSRYLLLSCVLAGRQRVWGSKRTWCRCRGQRWPQNGHQSLLLGRQDSGGQQRQHHHASSDQPAQGSSEPHSRCALLCLSDVPIPQSSVHRSLTRFHRFVQYRPCSS
jgi:hypothetical protein